MGEGVLPYLGMLRRFHVDDTHFYDCQSDLVPIVWCNQIRLTLSSEKISLCLSHLVSDIHGLKVGLLNLNKF